ncbi:hypothetical protein GCM10025794_33490 [Massilia kyonggiensis]
MVELYGSSFVFDEWDGEKELMLWAKEVVQAGTVEAPFWRIDRGPYERWLGCVSGKPDAEPVVL